MFKSLLISLTKGVFLLRKTVEGIDKMIAFGFDHMSGVFLQVFDKHSDERILQNLDQSLKLTGIDFAKPLTRNLALSVLEESAPDVLKDFLDFLEEDLDYLRIGYILNEEQKYTADDKKFIKTYGDMVDFIDSVDKHFILTDSFDCLISRR